MTIETSNNRDFKKEVYNSEQKKKRKKEVLPKIMINGTIHQKYLKNPKSDLFNNRTSKYSVKIHTPK